MTTGQGVHFRPTLVSVVIPARNAADLLACQLEAISAQDFEGAWEVLVADNGSTDGTAEVARAWVAKLPELRVVSAARRRGVNHARNIGAEAARGDFLVFCDADDLATPNWLRAMVQAASTADLVGGYLDYYALNTSRAVSWRQPVPPDRLPVTLGYLPFAVGASLGVRGAVFRALGGFDEQYAGRGDEVEFCWRAQLAGYTIEFAAEAVMRYRLRERLHPLARQGYWGGWADAQLMSQFQPHGVPPVGLGAALGSWCRLLCRLPELASRVRAGSWVFDAARRSGRLIGSIRYGVRCL